MHKEKRRLLFEPRSRTLLLSVTTDYRVALMTGTSKAHGMQQSRARGVLHSPRESYYRVVRCSVKEETVRRQKIFVFFGFVNFGVVFLLSSRALERVMASPEFSSLIGRLCILHDKPPRPVRDKTR
jgi:hypothetical protein